MIGLINNHRKTLLALAIVFAFIAVVVPTCRMIGCSMGGGASWGHNMSGLGIFGDCGGSYVTSVAPSAAIPSTISTITLALVAAVMMASVLARPPVLVERIRVHASDPPPPPEDPRGERLRL